MCEMLDPTLSPQPAPLLIVHEHRPCVGLDWCRCPCSTALLGFMSWVCLQAISLCRNDLIIPFAEGSKWQWHWHVRHGSPKQTA